MKKRILVIGGLAAGPSAASKAVRTNPNAEVTLFEQGEHISYGICEIPYYISGEVDERGLIAYTPERLKERKGVDARVLHKVEEIIPSKRKIVVHDIRNGMSREEQYDRLIVATGSRPRLLGVDGENARNVFTVKSLENAFNIMRYMETEKPKRAVIVGGGYIGMEMADALRHRGLEVMLLHRHSLPMVGLERETRERVREELEKNSVHFVAHARTQGFAVDKQQRVTHVMTSDGSYEADIVILSLGVVPRSDVAQAAGIRVGSSGGILTDQRQQTNVDNIYAAGDCCEVRNLVNNKSMFIPLATSASKAAWVAGENAAGGKATFKGVIRAIAVKVFDLEVVQVGISSEEASNSGFDVVTETITAWDKVSIMQGSTKVWIKTIADRKTGRLLGANLIGAHGAVLRANTLAVAIQHRLTIDQMQQWDLAYSPPFTPLWDPILIAANATRKKLSP
ncbi:MAG: FAD-dependent oxidoreductase [Ignavibacteriae bacterium]|nr:FAD-dependent oxidoreductase [Ignavibacteriota bacterium]